MPEYEMWKLNTNTTGWDIKYYKGLGTSTREEAKEYFADIEEHRKTFVWAGKFDSWLLTASSDLQTATEPMPG